eukprot:Amastigsp_a177823_23.p2 type:complete len:241 gc:universal Amastigsp_a177823_23:444-1166(+)
MPECQQDSREPCGQQRGAGLARKGLEVRSDPVVLRRVGRERVVVVERREVCRKAEKVRVAVVERPIHVSVAARALRRHEEPRAIRRERERRLVVPGRCHVRHVRSDRLDLAHVRVPDGLKPVRITHVSVVEEKIVQPRRGLGGKERAGHVRLISLAHVPHHEDGDRRRAVVRGRACVEPELLAPPELCVAAHVVVARGRVRESSDERPVKDPEPAARSVRRRLALELEGVDPRLKPHADR